jgi:hypothetical protein
MQEEDCRRMVDELRQEQARIQIKTVADFEAMKLDLAVMKTQQHGLQETFDKFCEWVKKELVNKDQFFPVRLIAYGLATSVLLAVLGGGLRLILK